MTRELAQRSDPQAGEAIETSIHEQHIWNVVRVRALVADESEVVTFFCGGSRNFARFIDLFDEVFVLDVDIETLQKAARPAAAGRVGV